MGKALRVFRVIERWCGREPERGSETLEALWLRHGPRAVPFDDEGAERLLTLLRVEFADRRIRLRPVDLLPLTVDGLIDAMPSVAAARGMTAAAAEPAAAVVDLSDDTIERLARRIAELIRQPPEPPRPDDVASPGGAPGATSLEPRRPRARTRTRGGR